MLTYEIAYFSRFSLLILTPYFIIISTFPLTVVIVQKTCTTELMRFLFCCMQSGVCKPQSNLNLPVFREKTQQYTVCIELYIQNFITCTSEHFAFLHSGRCS